MTKLIQRGLTSKNRQAMELFADRVSEFNKACGFIAVELEGRERPDGICDLELFFLSRAYARAFWTDDKYDVNIKPANDDDKEDFGNAT